MITSIDVPLAEKRYSIQIANELSELTSFFTKHLTNKQYCIITDKNVAQHQLSNLLAVLPDKQVDVYMLVPGEQHKQLTTVEKVVQFLIEQNHDRSTTLIAFGGGIVGDITGFVAAIYRRGVAYIQVPTTLLAQVDASIGGKTAVNHSLGKNMLGCFYQPKAVFIATSTLLSLSEREFNAGMAEVIKYALLADADFFDWLLDHYQQIRNREIKMLHYLIERCAAIKASIVTNDELEITGERALLNLGHTFAHAIETYTNYKTWLHGEAVAVGLLMATRMSVLQGFLSEEDYKKVFDLIHIFNLPNLLPEGLTIDHCLALMSRDKKVQNKQLQLVLLKKIGQAILTKQFLEENLRVTINEFIC